MNKGFSVYQQNDTMAMSQLDLILTVYRGAIRLLKQAKSDFENQRLNEGRTAIEKARKCIVHLYTTLDMEKGEQIAEKLGHLYAFMIEQLDVAVANKSLDLIDDVASLLNTIKEGWEGLKEQGTAASREKTASNALKVNAGQQKSSNGQASYKQGLTFSA